MFAFMGALDPTGAVVAGPADNFTLALAPPQMDALLCSLAIAAILICGWDALEPGPLLVLVLDSPANENRSSKSFEAVALETFAA